MYQNSAYLKRQERIKRDRFRESIKSSILAGIYVTIGWILIVIFTA